MNELDLEKQLEEQYSFADIIKRFYQDYLTRHGRVFFTVQAFHVVGALLTLVPPLILRMLIDVAIPEADMSFVLVLVSWALMIFVVEAIMRGLKTYWGHNVAQFIVRDMRNDLYRHYQRLSMSFHDNKKTGELMSRMMDDLNKSQEFVHHGPEALLNSLTLLIGTVAILLTLSVPLTLVALAFVPLLVVFSLFLLKKMHRAFRETRRRVAFMHDRLEDNLSGISVIKVFANEVFEGERFASTNEGHVRARLKALKYMSLLFSGSRFLNALGLLAVLSYGAFLVINGHMTLGTIVAFYGYMLQFRAPILQLVRTTEGLSEYFAAMERFFCHLDLKPNIENVPRVEEHDVVRGEVTFDDVHFSYESDDEVLRGVSFTAGAHRTIALVGPSGAGKSTIIRLIPRLYDVNEGRILIDGEDVRDWDLQELRARIAMVMQDEYLFSDSVAENIAYGKPHSSKEEVEAAAKAANAHDFILDLPQGYATKVGQRGVKLSGGQRQRVSIARAFLKSPRILILDEATSSVDVETEQLIQEAVDRVTEGRTTFIIAHRLSTIVNANEIFFIDDGRIRERGTHDELMALNGEYRKYYELQFRDHTSAAS